MGVIQVETPEGVIKVEIDGETPTQQELDALDAQFFQQKPKSIDLATASREEIREYARKRRAMGLDPVTGEQLSEDEFIRTYKEPGVDYSTGVDSVGGFSRFQFGRMDTKEEKENYLESVVGKD